MNIWAQKKRNTHNQWQVNLIIVCELLIVLNDVWEINKTIKKHTLFMFLEQLYETYKGTIIGVNHLFLQQLQQAFYQVTETLIKRILNHSIENTDKK